LGFVGLQDAGGRGVALLNRGTRGHHFDARQGILRQSWLGAVHGSTPRGLSEPNQTLHCLTGRGSPQFACTLRVEWSAEGLLGLPAARVVGARGASRGRLPLSAGFLSVGPEPVLHRPVRPLGTGGAAGGGLYASCGTPPAVAASGARSGGRLRVRPAI
jgi:hypothetical protein